MSEFGQLTDLDGRPAVRFSFDYDHAADRVWSAITEPSELEHWFPSHVRMQPRVGGTVDFTGDPNAEPTSGTVLAIDPPHRLVFTWGADELHFELTPRGESACTLVLTDVLDTRDAAARNAAGWQVCLAELTKLLAGQRADGPHSPTAQNWQEHYDAYVAAGMPSGAEIPA